MTTQILLADIGGTNARLVIAGAGQRPPAPATFKPRNLDDLNTAIAMVLRKEGDKRNIYTLAKRLLRLGLLSQSISFALR